MRAVIKYKMSIEEIRNNFPALQNSVYGKPLVYLDNAATAQRPQSVIDKWNEISIKSNANIHRAVYKMAEEATIAYEQARDVMKDFLNANTREEILFTSGATASLNLVAHSFGEAFVNEGDEIITTEIEHHSNIVPWQLLCLRKKAVLKFIKVNENGALNIDDLESLISEKTRLISITHISNVLGIINPIERVIEIAHRNNVPVLVDGSQGIVHTKVDVQKLDVDFYAFSGHKLYAATGTGVLYGKKKFLDAMPPFLSGGEMVDRVTLDGTTFAKLPLKFEAGTQNFASAATLKPALEFVSSLEKEVIEEEETRIKEFMFESLNSIQGLKLYGNSRVNKINLFSFTVENIHHEDMALILDKMGVAVRSGQMCAEPLMTRFGVSGMLRVSFAPYNTLNEAEYFIKSLKKAIMMLQ